MICEKISGNISEEKYHGCHVDYVDIEWHEAFKKLHKKITSCGVEIGIRLGNDILKRGLRQGDVLWCEGDEVIAVNIPEAEMIVIEVAPDHPHMIPKVCYAIGNRHAALLYGETPYQFITPYNEPAFEMLGKLHGVQVSRKMQKMDFNKRISASVNAHTH